MPPSISTIMRILRYILLSSILLTTPLNLSAQDKVENDKKGNFWHLFSFKGIGLSADLFGGATYLISDRLSAEVALEANFGNRLYPIFEFGWGWCNTTDESTGIKYQANAPYYKAGFNYNFFTNKEKPNPNHYVYGLIRIGWSSFNYDVRTPAITDPVWGGSVALDLKDVDGACLWGEIGAGIKVKIAEWVHMGWSVRCKVRFTEEKGANSNMWYIPGYGTNKPFVFGGTYNLIFDIPIGNK